LGHRGTENGKRKTILIIEDEENVLSMMVKHLQHSGYQVMSASDGMEGLKLLGAGDYDLVITDIVMPYVSGVGVVTALKEKHPDIPVIVITGYGEQPMEAAMEKKADVVLAKPVKMAVLKEEIAKLLAQRGRS
jgi:CheY-like chemotaxis protein